MEWLDFEFVRDDDAVKHINHYATAKLIEKL